MTVIMLLFIIAFVLFVIAAITTSMRSKLVDWSNIGLAVLTIALYVVLVP